MSTKLNAEKLAQNKYKPFEEDMFSTDWRKLERSCYAAAIREVAQPIAKLNGK